MRALVLTLWISAILYSSLAQSPVWTDGPGFRSAPLPVPATGHAGFSIVPGANTGISFTNFLSEHRSLTNQIYLNGSGIAAGDIDGDGKCDLYFCGLDRGNALYRNLGNWHFEDITDSAGVRCLGFDSTGAVFADIDGDGDLDLIVNTIGHGTHCFLNDGNGHFTEATKAFGLESNHGSMSMALADVDGDGYLDLYVANYRIDTLRDLPNTRFHVQMVKGQPVVTTVNGRPVSEPDLEGRYTILPNQGMVENGEVDILYRNRGGTNFVATSFLDGSFLDENGVPLKTQPYDWGLSVLFHDLNGDGLPDIYVCNDFESPDRIWLNQGNGRFRALHSLAIRHTSLFSMGADIADINRDGRDDIFVADMLSREPLKRLTQMGDVKHSPAPVGVFDNRPQYKMNTLFLNRGDGTYAEIANFSDVSASEWSWTPLFLDVDLDGYEDLLVTNGHERDAQNVDIAGRLEGLRKSGKLQGLALLEARRDFPRLATANLAFRNQHDLTFKEVGHDWGFDTIGVSQGMVLADLDNDGDLDVIINNLNASPTLLRNEASAPRVAVRLKGLPPNTQGIGAKIRVLGGPVSQSQEVICGGRYLSGDDPMRVFAAGTLTNQLSIEVTWRDGKQSKVPNVAANQIYEIDERGATPSTRTQAPAPKPLFEDVSALLNHDHVDEAFDDFARQPLLPKKLSQLGPGATWFDFNGDGWDDLIIGTGKGGTIALFQNDGHGKFARSATPPLDRPMTRDTTSILGWFRPNGNPCLLAGSSNYEDGLTNGSVLRLFDLKAQSVEDSLPGQASSTGPMALADIDGDGDLDLFVGGRTIPGHYPEPASSLLFRNDNGQFHIDQDNSGKLAGVGLISGAVFSDLNGDGFPDLILASEWGPIRIFLNEKGKFRDATRELGLDRYTGWWNGVTTGDFDGDGKLDIVASNWGLNSEYHASASSPRRIYYGDFDGDGTIDLFEAYHDSALKKEVPDRDLGTLAKAIPSLRERFPTYASFASASISDILGDKISKAKGVSANTLQTMVFLNRGDHFEAVQLPAEAQFAPAFGVIAGDFDGDGSEDIFLSQNFFGTAPSVPRCDSGRGLMLKGDGHGAFKVMPGQESGLLIYGEQRGAAMGDYDHDGRVDLVVTQNGTSTKLYHNVGARPGLRVRLNAGPGNPTGIGAVLRLVFGQQQGPAREIHGGSGYWSQDGAVQVMGTPEPPAQISIRWPGGQASTFAIPAEAIEIEASPSGLISRKREP